jgi:hypothetical protein
MFCLFATPGFSQAGTFRLRIENLQCERYRYNEVKPWRNITYDRQVAQHLPIAPTNGMVTITDNSAGQESFQFGFVPSDSLGIDTNIDERSFLNIGIFRFTLKSNPNEINAEIYALYSFDLTDGVTKYKMQLQVFSLSTGQGRRNFFFVSGDNYSAVPDLTGGQKEDQALLFPGLRLTHKVSFNLGYFHGTWDMIPLVAEIKTLANTRTLRTLRSKGRVVSTRN